MSFEYSNLSGRPPGPVVATAARVSRGVRAVQEQVEPYARAWEESNRLQLERTGPLWVVIGDSMSQGIGASAFDRGWVGQVWRERPDWRVVNLSFNGARVADVLDRQLPAMASLGVEPDLVTVMIGSNDLFSRRWRPLLPSSTARLLELLPAGTVVANQPGNRDAAATFNRQIDDAVARRGLVLADFRVPQMRSWRGRLASDHFHPNDAGYAGMAEIMAAAIP